MPADLPTRGPLGRHSLGGNSKGNLMTDVFLDWFYLLLNHSNYWKRFRLRNFWSGLKNPGAHCGLGNAKIEIVWWELARTWSHKITFGRKNGTDFHVKTMPSTGKLQLFKFNPLSFSQLSLFWACIWLEKIITQLQAWYMSTSYYLLQPICSGSSLKFKEQYIK